MRFDDRLSTLLEQDAPDDAASAILWTQLVDVFAQNRDNLGPGEREAGLARMEALWPKVPSARRAAAANAVAARLTDPDLLLLFASDSLAAAVPPLRLARIEPQHWPRVISKLSTQARAILRERPDLPEEAVAALNRYGAADFALPGGGVQDEEPVEDVSETIVAPTIATSRISELVSRIENWRTRQPLPVPPDTYDEGPVLEFRFETDASGAIVWLEGGNRAALLGLSLSEPLLAGSYGVDGQAAGAFSKRAIIRNARLVLPGGEGEWRISADPLFRESDGRFLGYRGIGRRPRSDEGAARRQFGLALPSDLMRQLAHELRTPLNAVRGFAGMIEGEMLGQAAKPYRDHAGGIVREADRLLLLIDELDTAARIGTDTDSAQGEAICDPTKILSSLATQLQALERERKVSLRLRLGRNLPSLAAPPAQAAQLFGRLCSMLLGLGQPGEKLVAEAVFRNGEFRFAMDRPKRLKGLNGDALTSSILPEDQDNPDFPPLGLGFTFRLLMAQAKACGGVLDSSAERLTLILRPAEASRKVAKESN